MLSPRFVQRLNQGHAVFDFIGTRKRWYLASVVLLAICLFSFIFRGFAYGIEFEGGTKFQIADPRGQISSSEAQEAFTKYDVEPSGAPQLVGAGGV